MERNLPREQQIANPSPEGATRSSCLLRSVRTLLAPILLAGVGVAALDVPSPVDAKDPVKEVQKVEDPKLTALRSEITRLIADLDSGNYVVRDKAHRALEQMAVQWVQMKQQPFPLASLLQRREGYSTEQWRRLEEILAAHEYEELQLLWRPIVFQEPSEWKGRKDAPRVSEVLRALEKQTGRRISLRRPKGFMDGVVAEKLNSRTFWEVLESVRQPAGGKFDMYRSDDGSLSVYAEDHGVYASEGNVLGRAYLRLYGHPLDPERGITVNFQTDAIALGDASITKAMGVTSKGRKVELSIGPQHTLALGTDLVMPYEEGEQSVDLTVRVTLRGYETRVETVKDLAKVAAFPVGSCELRFLGVSKFQVGESEYWSINAQLLGKDDEYERLRFRHATMCRAFDVKGAPIAVAGYGGSASQWGWQFRAEPHSIELVLPGRSTSSEKKLVFKGIPLHR